MGNTAGTFRRKLGKNSGKTPETLSELFLKFPSRVRLGSPKPYNSRHLMPPGNFQNSPPRYGWGRNSFFSSKKKQGLEGQGVCVKTTLSSRLGSVAGRAFHKAKSLRASSKAFSRMRASCPETRHQMPQSAHRGMFAARPKRAPQTHEQAPASNNAKCFGGVRAASGPFSDSDREQVPHL